MKTQRIIYRAKNNTTGLTDVQAKMIRRNGSSVAINVSLVEISASTEPGVYELVLSTSTLATYGGAGFYDFYIDSTSKPAPDVAVRTVTQNDDDDIANAVNAVQTVVNDIQSKVNSGTYGLAAIKTVVDAIQATVNTDAAALADIQGSGFISANDSLKSISDRVYSGGKAI